VAPSRRPLRVEQSLAGGLANTGRVVRVGDTVRRPVGPHTPAVHALLTHLADVGFEGAPHVVGIDELGREVLTYLDGDVATPPYPAWVGEDELLDSVAELQARYHHAVASFRAPPNATWNPLLAQPDAREPGLLVCHNDLCLENVVVRQRRAVGFIDFDMAAPVEPAWDLAVALRHWVPVRADDELGARAGVDRVARWHRWLDIHQMPTAGRARLVELTGQFLALALRRIGERAAAGEPAYLNLWQSGYQRQNLAAQEWLAAHAAALAH
jgi:Phosphotransferase enzyme family